MVAVVGIAGVVAVFVAVLSMAEGFRTTMANTGSPDTAIVMRSGADSEMVSALSLEDVRLIGDAAGVLRGAQGPVASGELFVIVDLNKRSTNTTANVPLRGVGPQRLRGPPERAHRRGPAVRDRAERADCRAGRRGPVLRDRDRADAQVRAERVDRRRRLRRGRHVLGLRAVVRRRRAAAGLPAGHDVPDRVRQARVGRGVHQVQGRVDDRSQAQPEGAARNRLLRRAVADGVGAHHVTRLRASRS